MPTCQLMPMILKLYPTSSLVLSLLFFYPTALRAEVELLKNGQAEIQVVAEIREATTAEAVTIKEAAEWMAQSLSQASGAKFEVAEAVGEPPSLIVGLKKAWPEVARAVNFGTDKYDAYAIITQTRKNQIYVLGNSDEGARHGVADLLRRWGFRWFAPSRKWHVKPQLKDLAFDMTFVESPQLIDRRIWYAYGMSGEDLKPLTRDYRRWAAANRLTLRGMTRTGHSYGNLIGRNKEAFANNPELSAMKEDGTRDLKSVPNARKFCFSNPDLIKLVAEDRMKLLEANKRINPASFMVSVDPSDGEGTCHCENCKKLGTATDRVMYLANETAKRLRTKNPKAWVGLYAYSSHRLQCIQTQNVTATC